MNEQMSSLVLFFIKIKNIWCYYILAKKERSLLIHTVPSPLEAPGFPATEFPDLRRICTENTTWISKDLTTTFQQNNHVLSQSIM